VIRKPNGSTARPISRRQGLQYSRARRRGFGAEGFDADVHRGVVVNLAKWANSAASSLQHHPPESDEIVVELGQPYRKLTIHAERFTTSPPSHDSDGHDSF